MLYFYIHHCSRRHPNYFFNDYKLKKQYICNLKLTKVSTLKYIILFLRNRHFNLQD